MTTSVDAAPGVGAAGKVVLAFMAFGLLVIFVSSFLSRLERPSLVVRQERRPRAMEQAVSGPMRDVMALMQKLQENPDDPGLQLAMAGRFLAMGAYDKAKVFLDKVARVRPDDPEVQNALGVVRFHLQDIDGARAAFEGVLAGHPQDVQARFNLGLLYKHALGAPDKAAELFHAVIDAPETDAETRNLAQKELEEMSRAQ